jgi:uncharacterized membrane protein
MIVLFVLLVAWALLRLVGAVWIRGLNTWRGALPYALAAMFLFTASAHFTSMRHDLIRMTPPWVPYPAAIVYVTGVLEILGAIGLMLPQTRRWAGIALIVFLIAVFPANVHAARQQVTIGGRPATELWLRLPMQLLFIGLVWIAAVRRERTAPPSIEQAEA